MAPTASLHFDDALLKKLEAKGINKTFVTLHVAQARPAGTHHQIENHIMHSEWCHVSDAIDGADPQNTRARGNKVIAVGTTATRATESAADQWVAS